MRTNIVSWISLRSSHWFCFLIGINKKTHTFSLILSLWNGQTGWNFLFCVLFLQKKNYFSHKEKLFLLHFTTTALWGGNASVCSACGACCCCSIFLLISGVRHWVYLNDSNFLLLVHLYFKNIKRKPLWFFLPFEKEESTTFFIFFPVDRHKYI